jgi:hypothetical protein
MKELYYVYSHQCLEDKWLKRKTLRYTIPHKEVIVSDALEIGSFAKLVEASAHISYFNRGLVMFYRGQGKDYRNRLKANTFYPTLFRGTLSQKELDARFAKLHKAAGLLVKALDGLPKADKLPGSHLVRRHPYLAWAILQHYEVCDTPLMDFTHSLRVAASFALDGRARKEGYLYLFGFPQLTDSLSFHVHEEMSLIRLLSFCPPDARRPYFQEGYVAGHFPSYDISKKSSELDFNNRMVAKFKLNNSDGKFWGNDFMEIPKEALFPNKEDSFFKVCEEIKGML